MVKVPIGAILYQKLETIIDRHGKRREEHSKLWCWECLRVKQSPVWLTFYSKKCSQSFWDRSQQQDANMIKPRQRKKVTV